ncbi:MAG: HAD-IA family hydrolase [Eubacteriales bacterium]|nr:HAD-IA family hydrolase [Eubacteriales bacterium]
MAGYDTLLFDFDGTIADSSEAVIMSWQYTLKKYTGKEGDTDMLLSTYGEQLDTTMARLLPDVPLDEALKTYRDFQESEARREIKLYPGVYEALTACRDKGYKLGIVTSRHRVTTMAIADQLKITDIFETIVTADDTNEHKPDPAPVLEALRRLESEPSEARMVGDAVYDLECSHNAGVKFALVGWSVALKAGIGFSDEKPDLIVENAADLSNMDF